MDEPDMPRGADECILLCKTELFPDDMKVKTTIAGVLNITLLIESGASCNIIDHMFLEYLKANQLSKVRDIHYLDAKVLQIF